MKYDDYYSASIVEKAIKIKYKKNKSIFTYAIVSMIKNDINVLKTLKKYNYPIPYKFINYRSRKNYIVFESSSLLFGMGIGDFICITVDKTGSMLFSDCKTNQNYSIKEFMDLFDGLYFNCFIQYHQELHRWLKDTFKDCGIDGLIITEDDIKAAFVQTKKAVKNYLGKIDDDDEGPIDEYKDRIINEYKDKIKEDYGIDLDDELEDEDDIEIPETSQINTSTNPKEIKDIKDFCQEDNKVSKRIPLPDHESRILVKFKRNEYNIEDNLYACGIFDFFRNNDVYSLVLYNGTIINFTSIDDFLNRVDFWVYL